MWNLIVNREVQEILARLDYQVELRRIKNRPIILELVLPGSVMQPEECVLQYRIGKKWVSTYSKNELLSKLEVPAYTVRPFIMSMCGLLCETIRYNTNYITYTNTDGTKSDFLPIDPPKNTADQLKELELVALFMAGEQLKDHDQQLTSAQEKGIIHGYLLLLGIRDSFVLTDS